MAAGILFSLVIVSYFIIMKIRSLWLWLLVLFFFFGMGRLAFELKPLPQTLTEAATKESYVMAEGLVEQYSHKEDICQVTLEKVKLFYQGKSYQLPRLITSVKEKDLPDTPIKIGMNLRISGELNQISPATNPGEFDYSLYYKSKKITFRLWGRKAELLGSEYIPFLQFLQDQKGRWAAVFDTLCTKEDAGIFKAVVLGDQSDLDQEIRNLYQKNGISHLLAISGLHISMIGLFLYGLFRKIGIGYGWSGLFAAILLISYGILTGASASTVRAVIMLLCKFLADYLGRTYDLLSATALAALLLLLDSPLRLMLSGFQLSFGAVLAIGLWKSQIEPWMEIQNSFLKSMALSLMIQLVTYPMILYHFFQYPVYSILLNFLVIPLMGIVVCSGVGTVLVGSVSLFIGIWFVGAGHYILVLYQWLCEIFSKFPGYSMILGRPQWWQLAVYTFLLLFFLLIHQRLSQKKWIFYLALCGVSFFLLWPLPQHGLTLTFADVGQGDGMLMQSDNLVLLIDGGSSQVKELGKQRLEPLIKSKGISKIDYIVVSHGDSDHTSGILYLLESCQDISVNYLVLPLAGKEHPAYETLREAAKLRGIKILYMKRGDRLCYENLTVTCLSPPDGFDSEDTNDHSLVLQVTYRDFRMLTTGDIGVEGEENLLKHSPVQEVDLLKVAHHGSKTSSCQSLLERIKPKIAVLSYGKDNSYGHPDMGVVSRLERSGARVYHTAIWGAIEVWTDGTKDGGIRLFHP